MGPRVHGAVVHRDAVAGFRRHLFRRRDRRFRRSPAPFRPRREFRRQRLMLGERILTAFGLVAVLALVLVVLPQDFALLALGVLILLGAWEWARLAGFSSMAARAAYTAACAAAMAGLWQATGAHADF